MLRGFIHPSALQRLEAESVAAAPNAYFNIETVNAYNIALDSELEDEHPAKLIFERGNAFVARDQIPADSLVHQLYTSAAFQQGLAGALCGPDPHGPQRCLIGLSDEYIYTEFLGDRSGKQEELVAPLIALYTLLSNAGSHTPTLADKASRRIRPLLNPSNAEARKLRTRFQQDALLADALLSQLPRAARTQASTCAGIAWVDLAETAYDPPATRRLFLTPLTSLVVIRLRQAHAHRSSNFQVAVRATVKHLLPGGTWKQLCANRIGRVPGQRTARATARELVARCC